MAQAHNLTRFYTGRAIKLLQFTLYTVRLFFFQTSIRNILKEQVKYFYKYSM